MIEADVMLRGQGTEEQELVPVMAQFPDTDSEVTFDIWLSEVIKANTKGIKLDFQDIDAVELTLQKLKDKKEEVPKVFLSLLTYFGNYFFKFSTLT